MATWTTICLLLALLPMLARGASSVALDRLEVRADGFALSRPLADFYDSVFVLASPGGAAPRLVTLDELADTLSSYDVVLFGEIHRHPGVHLQELRLLRALHERDPRIVLSLEQFERDVQGVVDDYVAGRIGERTLVDRGRAWDNYPTSYRPLLAYAHDHGLPVIAAEAPGWTISCIGQNGPDILGQFTPEERGWVARELHPTPGAYRDKFVKFQSENASHGDGGSSSPEARARAERSFTAQVARDDTMAESIQLARQKYPDRRILHLNGSFHSEGFLGTAERLKLRAPELRIAVIDPVEVEDPRSPALAAAHLTDGTVLQLVYPTPPDFAEGEDPTAWIHGIMSQRKASTCKYALPARTADPVAPAPAAPSVAASAVPSALVAAAPAAPAAVPAVAPTAATGRPRQVFQLDRLRTDVVWLAAPAREGRGIGSAGLDAAARYIAAAFQAAGLLPLAGQSYFQDFALPGPDGQPVSARNVLGVLPGRNVAFARQALVISAHYDHLGFGWPDVHAGDAGRLHPGADDNASGVAVLLELARVLADSHPERSIVFAAFSGEEEGLLGARFFVQQARDPLAPFPLSGIIADLNLDTVGRLDGGALTVFGAASAREWPEILGAVTTSTGIAIRFPPQSVDASDHTAFVEAGVPAVQLFASTGRDYHRPTDSADKIDFAGLALVATVVKAAVTDLGMRPEALHHEARSAAAGAGSAQASGALAEAAGGAPTGAATGVSLTTPARVDRPRRASTGMVPDMDAAGVGVRVASVIPGSGAAAAGLQAGDRVMALAGIATPDLRALAAALKTLEPGAIVEVAFLRDDHRQTATLTLGER